MARSFNFSDQQGGQPAKPYDYSTMTREEIRAMASQGLDPRIGSYKIDENAALELMAGQRASGAVTNINQSALAALPVSWSRGEFSKTGQFADARAAFDSESDKFWQPKEYDNWSDDPRDHVQEAAPITIYPTQTINPSRPRTVAAGYRPNTSQDRRKGTLTVIFRDGSYYNYYEVDPTTWYHFKAAPSKGRFIMKYLDSHPRGYADVPYITAIAAKLQYKIARTNQLLAGGKKQNEIWSQRRQPNLQRRLVALEREARREFRAMKVSTPTGTNPNANKGKAKNRRKP